MEFKINVVPKKKNIYYNLLSNFISRLITLEVFIVDKVYVDLLFRPSVHDNVTSWRVFDDDE